MCFFLWLPSNFLLLFFRNWLCLDIFVFVLLWVCWDYWICNFHFQQIWKILSHYFYIIFGSTLLLKCQIHFLLSLLGTVPQTNESLVFSSLSLPSFKIKSIAISSSSLVYASFLCIAHSAVKFSQLTFYFRYCYFSSHEVLFGSFLYLLFLNLCSDFSLNTFTSYNSYFNFLVSSSVISESVSPSYGLHWNCFLAYLVISA